MGRIIQLIWSVMVMIAMVKSDEDFEYRLKQMEQKFASQLQAVRQEFEFKLNACSNSKGLSDNIRDRRVVNEEEPVIAFSTQLGPEKNHLSTRDSYF
ncbi:hypothetical protein KP79_PYT03455 [Mizuhopecten yessoensis]|uniref:Uncharacterized protein n=1 Tax=Mizuhopecten yessoensis TaxID=6573 RepID=A0A210PDA8_MIZYE|nr:hypothetical protein KP79_PYT03455 [Mizuhopecten yessoensis]